MHSQGGCLGFFPLTVATTSSLIATWVMCPFSPIPSVSGSPTLRLAHLSSFWGGQILCGVCDCQLWSLRWSLLVTTCNVYIYACNPNHIKWPLVLIGKDFLLEEKQRTNGFQVYIYIIPKKRTRYNPCNNQSMRRSWIISWCGITSHIEKYACQNVGFGKRLYPKNPQGPSNGRVNEPVWIAGVYI